MRWIVWIWVGTAWAQTFELPATVKQGGVIRVRGPAAAAAARMGDRKVRLFPVSVAVRKGAILAPRWPLCLR
jgi:hypothetical protein